jgi:hypothetical protein
MPGKDNISQNFNHLSRNIVGISKNHFHHYGCNKRKAVLSHILCTQGNTRKKKFLEVPLWAPKKTAFFQNYTYNRKQF